MEERVFAKRMTFLDQLELGIDSQLDLVLQLKHVHCAQMGTLGIDGDYGQVTVITIRRP